MKKFKIIFAFILTTLFLFSCSEDESAETHKNLLLQWSDKDNGLIADYTYDSNNKLINYKLNGNANNLPQDYNFIYNSDGTLAQVVYASSGNISTEYTYNSDKKLIKKVIQNIYQYTYTYNENEITSNSRNLDNNTGSRAVYTYDSKGNNTETKFYSNTSDANPLGTYSGVIKYTYDDKNNSQSSVPYAFIFPNSVNNIKSDQYDDGGGEVYTFEYNADNYPVKRTGYDVRTYVYKRL